MVYVDNARHPYRRMIMCHMVADTTSELLAMADTIGVDRKWIQRAGTPKEHFDVCLKMRKKAIEAGAVEVSSRELCQIIQGKRNA